jgi:hypothetical protein
MSLQYATVHMKMRYTRGNPVSKIQISDLKPANFLEEISEQEQSNTSGGVSIVRQYNDLEGVSSIGFGVSIGGTGYGLGIGFGSSWGSVKVVTV